MTPEQFRRHGHQVVDWIADYRARVADLPVAAPTRPGAVREALPAEPPGDGAPFDHVLDDLERIVAPHLTHWASPRFLGYFPANSELSSVLGDFLSSGLGVLGLSWQSAPALTELEEVVTDWMRQMVGLSAAWSGVIQDTASTSTLIALIAARERATNHSVDRGGLQHVAAPLVVYTSDLSHSSIEKAARLAGFGSDNVRRIRHDAAGAMDTAALAAAMRADREAGRQPCAIVATTGGTISTSLDPIDALVEAARGHEVWLHVDAAMAGSAMLLPECRWMWAGVEGADSVVINPHKWLGAVFDCSLFYVRDPDHLVRVMGTAPSYLRSDADPQVRNYRDWGIALGRRFRALKLWTLIRHEGVHGLQQRLRRDLDHTQWLVSEIAAAPDWRVICPTPLQTICVRHEPPGLAGDALDQHTLAWIDRVNRSGAALLTPAQFEGRWLARIAIGGLTTERDDLRAAWSAMREAARDEAGS